MEILIILFFAFCGYWITKSIKKNMFDPLDERVKRLENLIFEKDQKKEKINMIKKLLVVIVQSSKSKDRSNKKSKYAW